MKAIAVLLTSVLFALSFCQPKPTAGVYEGEYAYNKTQKTRLAITLTAAKNGQFTVSGTWTDVKGTVWNISGTLTRSGSLRGNAYIGTNKNDAISVYGRWVPNQGLKVSVRNQYVDVIVKKKGASKPPNDIPALDIAGKWTARISSQYGWLEYTWEIQKLSKDKWEVQQFLVDTDHPVHKPRIGEQFHNYTIEKAPDGSGYVLSGSGGDPNPHNPGAFTQTAKLSLSNGKITGKGMHTGSQLTHSFEISATRSK